MMPVFVERIIDFFVANTPSVRGGYRRLAIVGLGVDVSCSGRLSEKI